MSIIFTINCKLLNWTVVKIWKDKNLESLRCRICKLTRVQIKEGSSYESHLSNNEQIENMNVSK